MRKAGLISSLLLRGLGVTYLVAFRSLGRQVRALFGREGIVPVAPQLAEARAIAAASADPAAAERRLWREVPSLLWLGASDEALVRWCRAGEACGAALALGLAPRAAAAGGWAIYRLFVAFGGPFLSYQWDVLLLEAGLAAALTARAGVISPARMLLFRLLAVRLHLESGLAKVQSGDAAWRRLVACAHHFETQPLPTPLAWPVHALPLRTHRAVTAAVLALECAAPLLAAGGRRTRRAGWALLTGLQGAIAATGNYAFFNLLTGVLTLSFLDERPLRKRRRRPSRWRLLAALPGAVVTATLGALSLLALARRVAPRRFRSRWVTPVERVAREHHAVNSYGLFAVMTRRRPEIVIEGSDDGVTWKSYELPYKPGDPRRRSGWVAPHQPRLDWQLWFAALGAPPRWFEQLLRRLLEGSPAVLALFAENPFPERPPRYVRAMLYEYHMTDRPSSAAARGGGAGC